MKDWLIILGMMLVTLPVRASFLVFGHKLTFPERLKQALKYVPICVLTALIVPAVLAPENGQLWLSPANPYLIGAIAAGGIALYTRNTLLALVLSFILYALVRWC